MERKDAFILGKDSQDYVNANRDANNYPFGIRKPNCIDPCSPCFDYDFEVWADDFSNSDSIIEIDNRQDTRGSKACEFDLSQGRALSRS